MKPTILALLSLSLLAAPFQTASAANLGGLKTGDRFDLKVSRIESTRQVGIGGAATASAIPAGVPKYRKNQKLTFRIRSGGRLSTRGLSIPFAHYSKGVAEFNFFRPGTVSLARNAELKVRKGKVSGGTLSFFITDSSGMETIYRTVKYQLARP